MRLKVKLFSVSFFVGAGTVALDATPFPTNWSGPYTQDTRQAELGTAFDIDHLTVCEYVRWHQDLHPGCCCNLPTVFGSWDTESRSVWFILT